ncbi:MAG: GNAT family N-acetyltransferase [Sarcina sp.]
MSIEFIKTTFKTLEDLVCHYYTSNDILIDSYLENLILKSNHYKIKLEDKIIGFCAVYEKHTLILFNVNLQYASLSQEIFFKACKLEFVNSALVSTSDEFFFSHALDNSNRFEKEAYFTRSNNKILENSTSISLLLAHKEDELIINELSENHYIETLKTEIAEKRFFIAKKDKTIVGFGHLEHGFIAKDKVSIGMYVCEPQRNKGYGTDILIELKKMVLTFDKEPIAGCWYLNHNSLKTQIKAGQYAQTRMIKFYF